MSNIAQYLERKSRDSATFDNTYQTLGSITDDPALVFKIINNSNVDIDVSTDATTDHDFVPAGSFTLFDVQANHDGSFRFAFPAKTQFSIKGAAAGIGLVYLVVIKEK